MHNSYHQKWVFLHNASAGGPKTCVWDVNASPGRTKLTDSNGDFIELRNLVRFLLPFP